MSLRNYQSSPEQFSDRIQIGANSASLFNGRQISPVTGPLPAEGLYENIEGLPAPGPYYEQDPVTPVTLSFTGTEFQADGRTVETNNWIQIPLDDLLVEKQAELRDWAEFIRVQPFRYDAQFWVQNDSLAQDLFLSAGVGLSDRAKDITIGQDSTIGDTKAPTTYWAGGDINLVVIRNSNGNRLFFGATEVLWGNVLKQWALFNNANNGAAVAVTNAINAAYDASDWQALADIVVSDPVYGWAEYYTGAVSPGIRAV